MNDMTRILDFLAQCEQAKTILRKNVICDQSRYEDIAQHAYSCMLYTQLLRQFTSLPDVDVNHASFLLLVHDLPELLVGDTYCFQFTKEETLLQKEETAAKQLFAQLPRTYHHRFLNAWQEFTARKTKEACYANAVDRIQPFILDTLTEGSSWRYGKITKAQLCERMLPVKTVFPDLYVMIEEMMEEQILQGNLKK